MVLAAERGTVRTANLKSVIAPRESTSSRIAPRESTVEGRIGRARGETLRRAAHATPRMNGRTSGSMEFNLRIVHLPTDASKPCKVETETVTTCSRMHIPCQI